MNACPPGKILNPVTGRCVKIDGRIGKTLISAKKDCKSGEILNPATGRCVKIDGRVGKSIIQVKQTLRPGTESKIIGIIFRPGLSILVNSSFNTGRSASSVKRKNIWEKITIHKYLKWYNMFQPSIVQQLQRNSIQLLGFSIHSKTHLLLKIKVCDPDINLATFANISTIKFAMSPDVDETEVVLYKNVVHLVECEEIKKVFFI